MKEKAIKALEFPKIVERLARFTSFSASRELALALAPAWDEDEVVSLQQRTSEACRLLDVKPGLTVQGASDIRPIVRRAALEGVLEPRELLEVGDTAAAGRQMKATITKLGLPIPNLSELASGITVLSALEARIHECIGDRADVRDAASPALQRLREEAKTAHERLVEKLNEIVNSRLGHQVLQEPTVRLREGRYVLPLKADCKGQLKGIIHDVSASGATLFVEPMATVEMNNQWRRLLAEEEREVQRILRSLSRLVGKYEVSLSINVECLAEIDLALAKAKLGQSYNGVLPKIPPRSVASSVDEPGFERPHFRLRLIRARHPLLSGNVVPLDLELGEQFFILVITGPNTGGKTVALKTAGLLALMSQSGLLIPADEGSSLPVFSGVYADIGDEQSIEQSLSTFGSHTTNVTRVLAEVDHRSLVLLDEIGAGTDPEEGSALARSLLSYLLRHGIPTIATTHYSAVKVWANEAPGVENASVEFDTETLSPTYRLTIGLPGRSNAMAIAARLGLNQQIVDEAQQMLSPTEQQMESLLTRIQAERDEVLARGEVLAEERRATALLQERLQERLRQIEEEKSQIIETARQSVLEEIRELRERVSRLQIEATVVPRAPESVQQITHEAQTASVDLQKAAKHVLSLVPTPVTRELAVGETVWLPVLNETGQLVAGPDVRGDVEVQLNAFKVRLKASQVQHADHRHRPKAVDAEPQHNVSFVPRAMVLPRTELDLRGKRADEVYDELDRYLNDAYLASYAAVRIIHGKGTGTLRQVVRKLLAEHALVNSFEAADPRDGGDGVTIAHLAR